MKVHRTLKLPHDRSLFLFGPRQTGKSTLISDTFGSGPGCLIYDFLDSEDFRRLAASPETLRGEVLAAAEIGQVNQVVLDEVQRIPGLLSEVHWLIENGPSNCSYIMSGSSARKLKRAHADMLGGRARTYHLWPFSINELGGKVDVQRTLRFGLLPPVYLSPTDEDRNEILKSYTNTYIEEEVRLEAQVRDLGSFLRFLPIVAAENGESVNFANISRECGISHHLVREYYQILEDTLLGFWHMAYSRSERKKLAKHPKFYLFDIGVVRAINRKLTAPIPEHEADFGRAFEHLVITEIYKHRENYRKEWILSFYRTERGVEVDCIIEHASGRVSAIEIKATDNPVSKHCRGLRSFRAAVPEARTFLVCRVPRPRKIGDILAVGLSDLCDLLASLD